MEFHTELHRAQIRLIDRSNSIMEARGIKNSKNIIPYKLSIPLLEAATLEEDDDLQDKWALLIANSVDPNMEIELKRVHISILENLTSFEVILFSDIAQNQLSQISEGNRATTNIGLYPAFICPGDEGYDEVHDLTSELESALNNIMRLGLLYNDTFGTSTPNYVSLSALGKEFYSVCTDSKPMST